MNFLSILIQLFVVSRDISFPNFINLAERLTFFNVLMFAYKLVVIVTKSKCSASKDYQI